MQCEKCKLELSVNAKFCKACGTAVPTPPPSSVSAGGAAAAPALEQKTNSESTCSVCGAQLLPTKKFCGQCGNPNKTANSVEARTVVPALVTNPQPSRMPPPQYPQSLPVAKMRKWPMVVFICAAVVLFVAYRWYNAGVKLVVQTNPPGSTVTLDNTVLGTSGPDSKLVATKIARGDHQIVIEHAGYQSLTQNYEISPFATSASMAAILQLQTYRMTVQTVPPECSVYIDDKLSGKSDQLGSLSLPSVPDGQHTLRVESQGYPSASVPFEIHNNDNMTLNLAAKAAELAQRKSELLARANDLFRQNQFDAAISACDAVTGIVPDDKDALLLKGRIQQAKAILSH